MSGEEHGEALVFVLLGVYLLVGMIVLWLFETFTGRIRDGIDDAAFQVMNMMRCRAKVAMTITLIAIWVLWPVVIYGAAERWWEERNKQ